MEDYNGLYPYQLHVTTVDGSEFRLINQLSFVAIWKWKKNTPVKGQQRSPWLLTTYQSWDDPPWSQPVPPLLPARGDTVETVVFCTVVGTVVFPGVAGAA